ncbi:fumarylacetoacetate hydrolase family protein [Achromobacter xylosoxidans]
MVEADRVIDVTAGLPALSADLADWLPGQGTSWRMLALLAREASARLPLSAVRLLPPLRRPSAFLAIGGNYASHLREIAHLNVSAGEHQIWFNKQASCIAGPFDELVIPPGMSTLDYEVELAVVIVGAAATCRRATPSITSPDTPSAMTPASASAITAARPSRWRNHSILWGPWGRGWSR